MGCKQYARMLGLSRGYPHILYPRHNDWDAAFLQGRRLAGDRILPASHAQRHFSGACSRGVDRHINILKNLARSDSLGAIGRLDQIVAGLTTMFTPEYILELQRHGELFGADKKT